jgi:hypothetical protein
MSKAMTADTKPRYLRAYYYSFEPTGNDAVDAILEAVALAGRAYHHTDQWSDSNDGKPSYTDQIQQAANEAARKWGSEL